MNPGNRGLPRRRLGRTGLSVSTLALGTVAIGRQAGLKYAHPVERPTDEAVLELLQTAKTLGINFLDTATAYGDSQRRLGELLPGLAGERFIVSTKVGERFLNERSVFDFSAAAIREDLDQAREQLRRPALDVVLLHSSGEEEEALIHGPGFEALLDARSRGSVTAVGLSAKTAGGIDAACAAGADVLMVTLNHQDRSLVHAIANAGQRGVGVLIKKPLASGHRPASDLRWVANCDGVSAVVVGTLSPAHLQANAAEMPAR